VFGVNYVNENGIRKDIILPNFLIIGALKSGTNSLYHYIQFHPQVFMCPIKEPSFFAYEGQKVTDTRWTRTSVITRFEDYLALFEGAKGNIAIGEASPMYLVTPQAPGRIKHYIPEVRLIAILRNPVDRAYSQWQMEIRNGTETINDFAKALQVRKTMPDGTVRQRFVYGGKYYSLLKRYYDLFDSSQICVLLFDQLCSDPNGLLQKVYHFLNIDPTYVPSNLSERYNVGGVPSNRFWGVFFQNIYPYLAMGKTMIPSGIRARVKMYSRGFRKQFLVKPPELSTKLRSELMKLFKEDILNLQDLIHQDLSIWL